MKRACDETYQSEFIDKFYEELSETSIRELEKHVAACEACRREEESVRQFLLGLPKVPTADWETSSPLASHVILHAAGRKVQGSPWMKWEIFRRDWREFWGPVLAMAAVVAVIWTGPWRTGFQPPTPLAAQVMGGGEFLTGADAPGRLSTFQEGSVAVAQGGPVIFSLPRINFVLAAKSRLTFRTLRPAHTTIYLTEGTVTAEIVPGTPLIVKTPLGEARAKGTKFQVQLKEIPVPSLPPLWGKVGMGGQGGKKMKRIMTVIVLAGVVEVVNPFGSVMVAVGQQAAVTEGKAPATKPLLNAETEPALPSSPKVVDMGELKEDPKTGLLCWKENGQPFTGVVTYSNGLQGVNGRRYVQDGRLDPGFIERTYHPNGQKKWEGHFSGGAGAKEERSWNDQGIDITRVRPPLFPPVNLSGQASPPAPSSRTRNLGFIWQSDLHRLIVKAVKPSSAAAEGKFQPGDIITAVEKVKVASPQVFETEVGRFADDQKLKVSVQRKDDTITLWLVMPRLSFVERAFESWNEEGVFKNKK